MAAAVPTLSNAGWITNIAEKADTLVSYYFVAEASQTHLYLGNVVSLPAQVQAYGNDSHQLRIKVRDDLQRYLAPYFDEVILDVAVDLPAPDDPNRINITVDCKLMENGVAYSLGRLISTVNSKIVNIVNTNNFLGG